MIGLLGRLTLGLDEALCDAQEGKRRVGLWVHCLSAVVSLMVGGASGFWGARVLGATPLAAALVCALTVALLWNMLRLLYAGSGVAASYTSEQVERWRPPLWPALPMLALGAALGQGLLMRWSPISHAAESDAYRQGMIALHYRAHVAPLDTRMDERRQRTHALHTDLTQYNGKVATLTSEVARLDGEAADATRAMLATLEREVSVRQLELARVHSELQSLKAERNTVLERVHEPYTRYIESASLPLLRARLLWRDKQTAGLLTFVVALVVAFPLVLRTALPGTLRGYEMECRIRERALIQRMHAKNELFVREHLEREMAQLRALPDIGRSRLSDLAPPEFIDAPFNRQRRPDAWENAERVTGRELLEKLTV